MRAQEIAFMAANNTMLTKAKTRIIWCKSWKWGSHCISKAAIWTEWIRKTQHCIWMNISESRCRSSLNILINLMTIRWSRLRMRSSSSTLQVRSSTIWPLGPLWSRVFIQRRRRTSRRLTTDNKVARSEWCRRQVSNLDYKKLKKLLNSKQRTRA